MISRKLLTEIENKLFKNKVIIVLGARQTGKTTLIKELLKNVNVKSLYLECDDPNNRSMLENQSTPNLLRLAGDNKLLVIDEAQRVENIGLTAKQIHDNAESCQIILSGSSALELSNLINEPLTGRKFEYILFPVSFEEMCLSTSWIDENRMLDTRLVFGYYPDVINNPGNEIEILKNLVGSYLYKDIFSFQEIRKPQLIEKLLKLLAYQVAAEVNYNELAQQLGVSSSTVERYIDLLEKSFVIFRLHSYSKNLRNELKKSRKIYFYDNGIRNMLISNFNSLNLRNDTGQLWENFLVSERMKYIDYNKKYCNRYFWRTTQQQEIDYIEEHSGKLFAYEFKWNENKKSNVSKTFLGAYPDSEIITIHRNNFFEFLM